MIFAQHNADTQRFFLERYGRIHGVSISDAPHGRFLAGNEDCYRDYLRASWRRHSPTSKAIDTQVRTYRKLVKDCRNRGIVEPVKVTHRFDGGELIVDGNHRSAIASAYGLSIEKTVIPTGEQLLVHTGADPYQTIYDPGRNVVADGRRTDIQRRFATFNQACPVNGMGVLDLGCSLGSHLFLAATVGATGCVGVDKSVDDAARLAAFYGAEIEFVQADLVDWAPDRDFDIACVFSVWSHLKERAVLCAAARSCEWLWLECHARTSPADYQQLLDGYQWETIGMGDDGELVGQQTRPWILGRRKC